MKIEPGPESCMRAVLRTATAVTMRWCFQSICKEHHALSAARLVATRVAGLIYLRSKVTRIRRGVTGPWDIHAFSLGFMGSNNIDVTSNCKESFGTYTSEKLQTCARPPELILTTASRDGVCKPVWLRHSVSIARWKDLPGLQATKDTPGQAERPLHGIEL